MDWLGPLKTLVPQFRNPLQVELPQPINPMGRMSIGKGHYPTWNVKVRLLSSGQRPVQVLELRVTEENVGAWSIDELLDGSGSKIVLPIPVHGACDLWVRVRSPQTFPNLPFEVGRLLLQLRDHTQNPGTYWTSSLTTTSTTVNK
jgi:hypothetical protein